MQISGHTHGAMYLEVIKQTIIATIVDGYDPSYYTDKIQLLLTKCVVDDTEVSVAPVDWEKASVTIFNRKRPELPKTGGRGTIWYLMSGFLLFLFAGFGISMQMRKIKLS